MDFYKEKENNKQMKRHINNPYKVNWMLYSLIGGISVLIMIVAVIWNNCTHDVISDVVKNLAFGCVASTIVALLIEIGNVKEKNEKANSIYDAVFRELQFRILDFVRVWSRLCSVAFKDIDYYQEKHTWLEWYEITKNNFFECDENRRDELMIFFNDQILYTLDNIDKTLKQIDEQQYILNINNVYNESMKNILGDYTFEVYGAKLTLEKDYNKCDFWKSFDAITKDFQKYIYNWIDIRYYNYCRFKPYGFYDDKAEVIRAVLESEKGKDKE
ncbi:MAG: hypothetical protein ACLU09_00590 [Clostridium sp.]|uniref:hypothetical protein n=1 Tax=Clostridium sp. AF15-41 TaxID=2292996 RepID=UPI001FAAABBE|nr:hypothetical protein [Clostridium sp. AF15-41]